MFKRVETKWEQEKFDEVWTSVWSEKGYELEYSEQVLDRFIVIAPDNVIAGTCEVKPYRMNGSVINEVAPFASHPKIRSAPDKVAEIDKLAMLTPYRGRLVNELLSAGIHFAEKYGYRYYTCLLEPVLYRALRISYHVPMEKIGDKIFYKGDYIVPVIIESAAIYENKSSFDWLVPAAKAEQNAQPAARMRA